MSCGILMAKYVITALLTYFIQYKKLAWGGRNYEKTALLFLRLIASLATAHTSII